MAKAIGTAGQVLSCVGNLAQFDSRPVALTTRLATSGEGEVWHTSWPGYLAKLYFNPTGDRIRKLEVMVANPPADPNAAINHASFAWPKAILQDASGRSLGFLMPEIAHSVGLFDVYNPQRRRTVLPGFNWLYLHVTAMNIASITQAIHSKGYVLGDIKPQNILVNNQALPSVIDTDSFQVRDPMSGQVFRCPVGSEGFTPPELLGRDLAQIDQTAGHDRFRLAVIIHLLLFGDQPYKGVWTGWGDSPDPNQLLSQGHWPYGTTTLIQPGPLTIPLETVHPEVQQCFLRCFNEGHRDASLRPTPAEWLRALKLAVADLKACHRVNCHYYSQSYGRCYWCDRKKALGVDIFPKAALSHQQRQARNQDAVAALVKPLRQAVDTASSYLEEKGAMAWLRSPLPQLTLPKPPSLTLPEQWLKYAVTTGLTSTALLSVLLIGKVVMAQKDTESLLFGTLLFIGLIALWPRLVKPSD
ncbi:helix-hairpin-helix domain-containing protein [Nodosilinea sp. PGN35]|uniref:helix-hairpin-helix domain-containing protein n=1 Tax=Nodosilinea sp. PGN35 TaxID=3020489 RepID=UPI0023B305AB|nr:hypothetical protein [Nodosilinea sp. TSF1-S3]MDF0368219.1 hypothetical protein [Nodosilinea sp. TSF1-S3]